MSARTIRNTDELVVAVPVDEIEIVDGPRFRRMLDNKFQLDSKEYVKQLFTMKTSASASEFQRELTLAEVYDFTKEGDFLFTAVFCGKVVSGCYNPRTRTGKFSLD